MKGIIPPRVGGRQVGGADERGSAGLEVEINPGRFRCNYVPGSSRAARRGRWTAADGVFVGNNLNFTLIGHTELTRRMHWRH